jgi:chromatin segregation and condensation protein Rec8/ScpA/Scc1 (kleisin family)
VPAIQQEKVVARHAAQNHPLQPVQIVESILGRFADRGQERLTRIFLQQAQQLPQGKSHYFAALLLQRRHIAGDLRRGL